MIMINILRNYKINDKLKIMKNVLYKILNLKLEILKLILNKNLNKIFLNKILSKKISSNSWTKLFSCETFNLNILLLISKTLRRRFLNFLFLKFFPFKVIPTYELRKIRLCFETYRRAAVMYIIEYNGVQICKKKNLKHGEQKSFYVGMCTLYSVHFVCANYGRKMLSALAVRPLKRCDFRESFLKFF